MSKDDFKKMAREEKAEYINNNLQGGMSFKDIYDATMYNNELIKSKEALLNQFKKAGYRVNDKNSNQQTVDAAPTPESQESVNNSVNSNSNDKLLAILKRSEDILQMLAWWENSQSTSAKENILTIPIPQDADEIRKTIRINNKVWDQWKEFCIQQPGYSEKDLFAKALLFYINEVQ